MLTTVELIRTLPGFKNEAQFPLPFLNMLIGAADKAIKTYLKREIELSAYVEYYSGNEQRDVILRNRPVLTASTTVASASNGVVLPSGTINVASTAGFHPGTAEDTSATVPSISVQTGTSPVTYTTVTYTATTATTFTGCVGGNGTLFTGGTVNSPVVWFDPNGFYGQMPNGFQDSLPGVRTGTQLVKGTQWAMVLDNQAGNLLGPYQGHLSNRALLQRIGGGGLGFFGYRYENQYSQKLASYRLPCWPRGDGNIKLAYSAGYPNGFVPFDIQYAAGSLVAFMARYMPFGGILQSETLGAYSYQILTGREFDKELGAVRNVLSTYREISFTGGGG